MTDPKKNEIELEPDAWQRFERAVKAVAKALPQHRGEKKKVAKQERPAKKRPAK